MGAMPLARSPCTDPPERRVAGAASIAPMGRCYGAGSGLRSRNARIAGTSSACLSSST